MTSRMLLLAVGLLAVGLAGAAAPAPTAHTGAAVPMGDTPGGPSVFQIVTECLSGSHRREMDQASKHAAAGNKDLAAKTAVEDALRHKLCADLDPEQVRRIKAIMRRPQPTDEQQNEMEVLGDRLQEEEEENAPADATKEAHMPPHPPLRKKKLEIALESQLETHVDPQEAALMAKLAHPEQKKKHKSRTEKLRERLKKQQEDDAKEMQEMDEQLMQQQQQQQQNEESTPSLSDDSLLQTASQASAGVKSEEQTPFPFRVMQWPEGKLRFYYHKAEYPGDDYALSLVQQVQFAQAVAYYRHYSCIEFEEVTPQYKGHILVVQGRPAEEKYACATRYAGFARFVQTPGEPSSQWMRIGEGCGLGSVIHELGHVLGMRHTQTRLDRAKFLDILFMDIPYPDVAQYFKGSADWYKDVGAYDYGSVMHYPMWSYGGFVSGLHQVMLARFFPERNEDWWQGGMGQRDGLSWGDIANVNNIYSCPPHFRSLTKAPINCTCPSEADLRRALKKEVLVAVEEPEEDDESEEMLLDDEDLFGITSGDPALNAKKKKKTNNSGKPSSPSSLMETDSSKPAPAGEQGDRVSMHSLLRAQRRASWAENGNKDLIVADSQGGSHDRPYTRLKWCESAFHRTQTRECRIYCRNQPQWKAADCWINGAMAAPMPTMREMAAVAERLEKHWRDKYRATARARAKERKTAPKCDGASAYVSSCISCDFLINNPFESKVVLTAEHIMERGEDHATAADRSHYSRKVHLQYHTDGQWAFHESATTQVHKSFHHADGVLRGAREYHGCCCVKGCRKKGVWDSLHLYALEKSETCMA